MRDFYPIYSNWLKAIGYENSFDMFYMWLWTLTDQQLDEVDRKFDYGDALNYVDSNPKVWNSKIKDLTQSVRNVRMEWSLLVGPYLANPLDNIEHMKSLLDVYHEKVRLTDLSDFALEKYTQSYNCLMTYDGAIMGPNWSENIATEAKNLLAERFLFEKI